VVLAEQGFHNVTVLEKLGRIGGLCKSLTADGMSYDLGANDVTWAYQET
jgi:phytoene dehydrogenase-like protein